MSLDHWLRSDSSLHPPFSIAVSNVARAIVEVNLCLASRRSPSTSLDRSSLLMCYWPMRDLTICEKGRERESEKQNEAPNATNLETKKIVEICFLKSHSHMSSSDEWCQFNWTFGKRQIIASTRIAEFWRFFSYISFGCVDSSNCLIDSSCRSFVLQLFTAFSASGQPPAHEHFIILFVYIWSSKRRAIPNVASFSAEASCQVQIDTFQFHTIHEDVNYILSDFAKCFFVAVFIVDSLWLWRNPYIRPVVWAPATPNSVL